MLLKDRFASEKCLTLFISEKFLTLGETVLKLAGFSDKGNDGVVTTSLLGNIQDFFGKEKEAFKGDWKKLLVDDGGKSWTEDGDSGTIRGEVGEVFGGVFNVISERTSFGLFPKNRPEFALTFLDIFVMRLIFDGISAHLMKTFTFTSEFSEDSRMEFSRKLVMTFSSLS